MGPRELYQTCSNTAGLSDGLSRRMFTNDNGNEEFGRRGGAGAGRTQTPAHHRRVRRAARK
jgi:hypothetical protein